MIVAGLLGMSANLLNVLWGIKHRKIDENGEYLGSMYYLCDGLAKYKYRV